MTRLPLVEVAEDRCWIAPTDIRDAFQIQQRFVFPDFPSISWTLLVIISPSTYYLTWVLPQILRSGEAFFDSWACLSSVLWAIASLGSFAMASCRNPGVVPRLAVGAPGKTRLVVINGVVLKQRYCNTCRIYRPMRSKHCALCNRCVFRFDHHCTWLGNCVGLGNYRTFLFLISVATLFFGQAAIVTCKVLHGALAVSRLSPRLTVGKDFVHDHGALYRTMFSNAGKVLFAVYATLLFFALFVLLLYHSVILSCNLTTNEHVRDAYPTRNPYDVACLDNCKQIFCAPYGRIVSVNTRLVAEDQRDDRHCV